MTPLLVALGAAIGGVVRHALTTALDGRWPLGTLLVNAGGSALLGLGSALALDGHVWAFVATGFCGALTTYSSFAVQAIDRPRAVATAYIAATVASSLVLCAAGWYAGTVLA
jgi:CrcB protein